MSLFNQRDEHLIQQGVLYTGAQRKAQKLHGGDYSEEKSVWTPQTEAEYFEKVKSKASSLAKEIIEKAAENKDSIEQEAYQKGYASGEEEGRKSFEQNTGEYLNLFGTLLKQLESYTPKTYKNVEKEMKILLPIVIEKVTGVILEEKESQILEKTILETLHVFGHEHEFIIYTHPDSYNTLQHILSSLQEHYPNTAHWIIRQDTTLAKGTLLFEDDVNLVESSVEKRQKEVLEILSHFSFTEEIYQNNTQNEINTQNSDISESTE